MKPGVPSAAGYNFYAVMDDNITRNKVKHTLTDKITSNENDQKPPSAIMNGRAVKCEGVHARRDVGKWRAV